MEKYYITIISYNEDSNKFEEVQSQDTKLGIARIFLTFKPKRGFHVVNVIIDVWDASKQVINDSNVEQLTMDI